MPCTPHAMPPSSVRRTNWSSELTEEQRATRERPRPAAASGWRANRGLGLSRSHVRPIDLRWVRMERQTPRTRTRARFTSRADSLRVGRRAATSTSSRTPPGGETDHRTLRGSNVHRARTTLPSTSTPLGLSSSAGDDLLGTATRPGAGAGAGRAPTTRHTRARARWGAESARCPDFTFPRFTRSPRPGTWVNVAPRLDRRPPSERRSLDEQHAHLGIVVGDDAFQPDGDSLPSPCSRVQAAPPGWPGVSTGPDSHAWAVGVASPTIPRLRRVQESLLLRRRPSRNPDEVDLGTRESTSPPGRLVAPRRTRATPPCTTK